MKKNSVTHGAFRKTSSKETKTNYPNKINRLLKTNSRWRLLSAKGKNRFVPNSPNRFRAVFLLSGKGGSYEKIFIDVRIVFIVRDGSESTVMRSGNVFVCKQLRQRIGTVQPLPLRMFNLQRSQWYDYLSILGSRAGKRD